MATHQATNNLDESIFVTFVIANMKMELKPLTKEQAADIAAFFKPLEKKHTFQFPGVMDTLIVTHVTIAPFKGPAQNDFRYNFQTGFDLKSIIDKYNGKDFTVLIIA